MVSQQNLIDEAAQNGELIYAAYVGETNGMNSSGVYKFNGHANPQVRVYKHAKDFITIYENAETASVEEYPFFPKPFVGSYLKDQSEESEETTIGGEITVAVDELDEETPF